MTNNESKTLFFDGPFSGRCWKASQNGPEPPKSLPKIASDVFLGGSGPKKANSGIPTWVPKSDRNPLLGVPGALPVPKGRPEPSGEPFWKHFGSILAPFWCNFWHQLGRPAIAAKPSRNRSKTAAMQQRHSSETAATQQQNGRAGQQAPG